MTVKAVDILKAAKAVKTAAKHVPDSYMELVAQFPLKHIRDAGHLEEALATIDRLLTENLDEGGQDYLDVLTDLVESYEKKHVQIPDASESDVLRELMRTHALSQGKLAKEVGIAQSTISAILSGTRSLTKEQVVKLAEFFEVPSTVFMPR